jgi:hypothetical protein
MIYAERTTVSVDQTRAEIERTLKRYGATAFAYASETGRAAVMFEAHARPIRFDLPLPPLKDSMTAASLKTGANPPPTMARAAAVHQGQAGECRKQDRELRRSLPCSCGPP